MPAYEQLEGRAMLATLYVDAPEDYLITADTGVAGLSTGDTVTWGTGDSAVTGLTYGTTAFGTLPTAVAAAAAGDTIVLGAGTYTLTAQLSLNKSGLTVRGVSRDSVVIETTATRSTETRLIQIDATNVSLRSLTMAGWQADTVTATAGRGYHVWVNNASGNGATIDDVKFDNDNMRVSVYIGTANDITITNSTFEGTLYRYAIRGAGERMNIAGNHFDVSFYEGGPIYMEYGANTSGTIADNVFDHAVGVTVLSADATGSFKSDGSEMWTIANWQPQKITASGLSITGNTFTFANASITNAVTGARPQPIAILNDPARQAGGPITITNNTFAGYGYQPLLVRPAVVAEEARGHALRFDGFQSFASFTMPDSLGDEGTFSAWVKIDSDATSRRNQIIEGPGNGGLEVQYRTNSGGQFYGTANPANNVFAIMSGPAATTAQSWTNLQFTWQKAAGEGGTMRLYVNGSEVSYSSGFGPTFTQAKWANVLETLEGLFYVGRDPGDAARMFDGWMDDIAFFNTVLDGTALAAVRDGTDITTTARPSLVTYWNPQASDVDAVSLPGAGGTATSLMLDSRLNATPNVLSVTGGAAGAIVVRDNSTTLSAGVLRANLTGGSSNDTLQGTPGDDVLAGGDGADLFTPGLGADSVDGGAGIDEVVLAGNYADYTIAFDGATVVVTGGSGVDTISDVEKLRFGDKAVIVVGNAVGSEYTTIAHGIAAANEGDVVLVAAGTYSENVTIGKSLTLLGAQAGVKATGSARTGGETIIDGLGNSSSFVVTVEADNVTIDGFKVEIRNLARDGINTRTNAAVTKPGDASLAYRENITIRNNWVYANLPSQTNQINGIVFGESTDNAAKSVSAEIANITIRDNYIDLTTTSSNATPSSQSITGARGIVFTNMFRNSGASLAYTGLVVDDNTVFSTYQTILQAQLQTRLVGATFTDNTIGNSRSGPSLPTLVGGSVFSRNTIQNINPGSDYYSNLAGAYLGVVDSTVSNNTFSNIGGTAGLVLAGGRSADPTYFPASSNSTVSGNSFTYNDQAVSSLAGYTSGVLFETDTISDAVNVRGWLTGRQAGTAGAQAGSITLSGNTFTNDGFNESLPAVAISQESFGTTVNAVNTTANTFNGISLSGSTTTTDLFSVADQVADVVDAATLGGVALRSGNVYVTPDSFWAPASTTQASIQRAIDASATDGTVHAAAGTYTGTVTIDTCLHVVGAGSAAADGTVLTAGSGETVLTVTASGTEASPLVLSGLRIIGQASAEAGLKANDDTLSSLELEDIVIAGSATADIKAAAAEGFVTISRGSGEALAVTELVLESFDEDGVALSRVATVGSVRVAVESAPLSLGDVVTDGYTVEIVADELALTGSIDSGEASTTLRSAGEETVIFLGGAGESDGLVLTDEMVDRVTAGALIVGSEQGGAIVIQAAMNPAHVSVLRLKTGAAIDGAGLVTAATVGLEAATGIGAETSLELAAATITAATDEGDIDLDNTLAEEATVASLTTGSGSITFDQSGGGGVTFTTVAATGGAIDLEVTGGSLTVEESVTASEADGLATVSLTTTTDGSVVLTGTTTGDEVTVSSAAAIDGAGLVTAATVGLEAATGIGAETSLELAAATITAATDEGDIDLDNTLAEEVTVASLTTGSGSIMFDQSGGGDVLLVAPAAEIAPTSDGVDAVVRATGSVTIRSDAAIRGVSDGYGDAPTPDIVADDVFLRSIGGEIEMTVQILSELEAGDVRVETSGTDHDVSVTLVSRGKVLVGQVATSNVRLAASGSITLYAVDASGEELAWEDIVVAETPAADDIFWHTKANVIYGVLNTNSDGPGSLKDAVDNAGLYPNRDTDGANLIVFDARLLRPIDMEEPIRPIVPLNLDGTRRMNIETGVRSSGRTVDLFGAGNEEAGLILDENASGTVLRGLNFIGFDEDDDVAAVAILGGSEITIDACSFGINGAGRATANSIGVKVEGGDEAVENVTISRSVFAKSTTAGLELTGDVSDVSISQNVFGASADRRKKHGNEQAIVMEGVSNIVIENNYLIDSVGTALDATNVSDVTIAGNAVREGDADGIVVGGSSDDVTIVGNQVLANGGDGIEVSGTTSDVEIQGNSIGSTKDGNSFNGVFISSAGEGIRVIENNILGNGKKNKRDDNNGVKLSATDAAFVSLNAISGNRGDGVFATTGAAATIEANTMASNGGSGVRLQATTFADLIIGADAENEAPASVGNVFSNNGRYGVEVLRGAAGQVFGNRMSGNKNGGLETVFKAPKVNKAVLNLTAEELSLDLKSVVGFAGVAQFYVAFGSSSRTQGLTFLGTAEFGAIATRLTLDLEGIDLATAGLRIGTSVTVLLSSADGRVYGFTQAVNAVRS